MWDYVCVSLLHNSFISRSFAAQNSFILRYLLLSQSFLLPSIMKHAQPHDYVSYRLKMEVEIHDLVSASLKRTVNNFSRKKFA